MNLELIESVPGTTLISECETLWDLVQNTPIDAVIVELGTGLGRTTCTMGLACVGTRRHIYSIDNYAEEIRYKKNIRVDRWEREAAQGHIERLGISGCVTLLHGDSADTFLVPKPVDLIFVDAGHTYESVRRDITAWMPEIKKTE